MRIQFSLDPIVIDTVVEGDPPSKFVSILVERLCCREDLEGSSFRWNDNTSGSKKGRFQPSLESKCAKLFSFSPPTPSTSHHSSTSSTLHYTTTNRSLQFS